jgi:hypothetical protein
VHERSSSAATPPESPFRILRGLRVEYDSFLFIEPFLIPVSETAIHHHALWLDCHLLAGGMGWESQKLWIPLADSCFRRVSSKHDANVLDFGVLLFGSGPDLLLTSVQPQQPTPTLLPVGFLFPEHI